MNQHQILEKLSELSKPGDFKLVAEDSELPSCVRAATGQCPVCWLASRLNSPTVLSKTFRVAYWMVDLGNPDAQRVIAMAADGPNHPLRRSLLLACKIPIQEGQG